MSGAHDQDDAATRPQPSRWAFLSRFWGYNAALLLLVVALICLVNVLGRQSFRVQEDAASIVGLVAVLLLIPLIAVLITRITVPRRASRVEKFRPSPWDVDEESGAKPQAARKNLEQPPPPPAPFEKRLANYLHVPESDVLAPRARWVSSMPFWCAVILPQRSTLAKSVEYIRAVLQRIRAAVRDSF